MPRGRKPEPTQPGNPQQLTLSQHVHSRWCIDRFANEDQLVAVMLRGRKPFTTKSGNPVFCAQRVWDEKLERGLFGKVEHDFHEVVSGVLAGGIVTNHRAVTGYVTVWQVRCDLAQCPPEDFNLIGVTSSKLKKCEEEILEKKGYMFTRGSTGPGATVPGRFGAMVPTLRAYDQTMHELARAKWGVLAAPEDHGFLCPDAPRRELYIPISRRYALVAGYKDQEIAGSTVELLNQDAARGRYIFGHPEDVATFSMREAFQ